MINPFYRPSLLKWIKKMFLHAESKKWYETYFLFDLHGVISKPDYRKEVKEVDYYPYAKETLQYISKNRPDVIMILFTSSYPDEIKKYMETFTMDNIKFKYVNENPEISDTNGCFGYYYQKPYFNVLFDDKAGFEPFRDWKPIFEYFKKTKYKPNTEWTFKKKELYHKI